MASTQLVVLAVLLVGAQSQLVQPNLEYDPHPQYSYGYSVNDPVTGDSKVQQETRDGDVVQGSYSLVEPDGSLRTVAYSADPVSGFNAVVTKDPVAARASAVPAPHVNYAAPTVRYAAPAYARYSPIPYSSYAAPLSYPGYADPYSKYPAFRHSAYYV